MKKERRLAEFPILGPEDVFDSRYTRGDGCWLWKGTLHSYGYGIFLLPGEVPVRAHRYAYERHYGPIPAGNVVMHICDNPPCVNPAHLRRGTRDDNNQDKVSKLRQPHGEWHHACKLTDAQVAEIRANTTDTQRVIAMRYKIDSSTVSQIKSGRRRASTMRTAM